MAATTWRYGDLEVTVAQRRQRFESLWTVLFVIAFVIAPTTAAAWALVRWFPLSLPIGLTIAALVWIGVIATAVDEDELA